MKALSIRQPWAWAILHGKDVENRTWATKFRGEFLIHTGKQFDWDGMRWLYLHRSMLGCEIPDPKCMLRGGIVGQAAVIDCVEDSESPWFFGPVGFVIANARQITFQRCKGRLGFFNVDYVEPITE